MTWSAAAKDEAEQQLLWDMQHAAPAAAQHRHWLLQRALQLWKLANAICLEERQAAARRQRTWQQVGSWLGEMHQGSSHPDAHPQHDSGASVDEDPSDDAWLGELHQRGDLQHSIRGQASPGDDDDDEHEIATFRAAKHNRDHAESSRVSCSSQGQSGAAYHSHLDEGFEPATEMAAGNDTWFADALRPSGREATASIAEPSPSVSPSRSTKEQNNGPFWQPASPLKHASLKGDWSTSSTPPPDEQQTWGLGALTSDSHEAPAGPFLDKMSKNDAWLADLLGAT